MQALYDKNINREQISSQFLSAMQNGYFYLKNNDLQRRDASEILDEFSHFFKWRFDGEDSLLDIGTGSGDVLYDFIIPKLPRNIHKVVGVDKEMNMVECARENFGNEFTEFHQLDISSSCLKHFNEEQFDNITSMYVFHWIEKGNQLQAFENVHKLLKPNGTALLVFLLHTPLYELYEKLSKFPRYRRHMRDVKKFISPYHFAGSKSLELVRKYAEGAGLNVKHLESRERIFVYENDEHLKNAVLAINPFTKRMSERDEENFMNDYMKLVREFIIEDQGKIITRHEIAIAVLSKPS